MHALTRMARHPKHLDAKGHQSRLDGSANRAISQDEHGRPLQVIAPGIDAGAMPATIALCTDVGRQVVSGGEHRHHHPLGDRYVVHTGAVAEGHPCGNGIQEPIDPGGHGLDYAEIVELADRLDHTVGVVIGDEELPTAQPVGERPCSRQIVKGDSVRQQRPVLGARTHRDPNVNRHVLTLHGRREPRPVTSCKGLLRRIRRLDAHRGDRHPREQHGRQRLGIGSAGATRPLQRRRGIHPPDGFRLRVGVGGAAQYLSAGRTTSERTFG